MGRTRRRSGAALAQGGFTYLELTVCMALMITILGLFVMAVESGSDALALSSRKGQIMWECLEALTMLERDFRETDAATIASSWPSAWQEWRCPEKRSSTPPGSG